MEEDHKNEGYGSIVLVTRKNIQQKTRKYERTEKKKSLRKNSHCLFVNGKKYPLERYFSLRWYTMISK